MDLIKNNMQGKETRIEDKQKVIEAKLLDPELSLRDIEKLTGVNYKVSGDIINKVPELVTGSNREEKMLDDLQEIIDDIKDITLKQTKRYKEKAEMGELSVYDIKQLNDIAKNNFDRKQLLTGKPTNRTEFIDNIDIL